MKIKPCMDDRVISNLMKVKKKIEIKRNETTCIVKY